MGCLFCLEDFILNRCECWQFFLDSGGHCRVRHVLELDTGRNAGNIHRPRVPGQVDIL